MKIIMNTILVLSFATTSLMAEVSEEKKHASKVTSYQSLIHGAVFTGTVLSFLYWLPRTLNTVKYHGILDTLGSTYCFHRLVLDAATIYVCKEWFKQENSKEGSSVENLQEKQEFTEETDSKNN